MSNKECRHSKLVSLLTKESIKMINGGNLAWCRTCGSVRHIDLDGRVGWVLPSYKKKRTKVFDYEIE